MLRTGAALGALLTLLFHIGFRLSELTFRVFSEVLWGWVAAISVILLFSTGAAAFLRRKIPMAEIALLLLFALLVLSKYLWISRGEDAHFLFRFIAQHLVFVYVSLTVFFLVELGKIAARISGMPFNPAVLFVGSFLLLILAGTFLLLLPKATVAGISFHDALFTSVSAVCVTGLIVVDTATAFTPLGQLFILILIQLGGLGIMTFTSFFAMFFKGQSSVQEALVLKDYLNTLSLGDISRFVIKVVSLTLFIEAVGAAIILCTLDNAHFEGFEQKLFFAVFHSVSAFCNAGFSTLSGGLADSTVQYNYPLHLTVALLVIAGGLGFSIVFNFISYLRHLVAAFFRHWMAAKPLYVKPWALHMNSVIVIGTTALLLTGGTLYYLLFEYSGALSKHAGFFPRLVSAFFASATARTAGFNTISYADLTMASLLFTLLLMWIGASPGSTGGGIKTSVFAVAMLNIISTARGFTRTEFYRREIAALSVRRSFAIIVLSFLVTGVSVFLLCLFETDKQFMQLLFESVSAMSTVGLSLGITSGLSTAGKYVIMLTMFIGRVGALTLLTTILMQARNKSYAYPEELILMN